MVVDNPWIFFGVVDPNPTVGEYSITSPWLNPWFSKLIVL